MQFRFVSNDVRRHRLISISYISLLPCHGISLCLPLDFANSERLGTPVRIAGTDRAFC
jgi:hypothetical protein